MSRSFVFGQCDRALQSMSYSHTTDLGANNQYWLYLLLWYWQQICFGSFLCLGNQIQSNLLIHPSLTLSRVIRSSSSVNCNNSRVDVNNTFTSILLFWHSIIEGSWQKFHPPSCLCVFLTCKNFYSFVWNAAFKRSVFSINVKKIKSTADSGMLLLKFC